MGLRNNYGNNNKDILTDRIKELSVIKDYWDGLYYVRKARARNRDFRNGRQWSSKEIEMIERAGNFPITNNYISLMLRNLIGQYITNAGSPVAVARRKKSANISRVLSNALGAISFMNKDDIKDRDMLEDLALGGIACSEVRYGYIPEKDRYDVITRNVNVNNLFFNTDIVDTCLDNLYVIGEICDVPLSYILNNFADPNNPDDEKFIREIYSYTKIKKSDTLSSYFNDMYPTQDTKELDNLDFFLSGSQNKLRYYIVWTKERKVFLKYHDTLNATYGYSELSKREIDFINETRKIEEIKKGGLAEEAKLIKYEQSCEFVWRYKYITPNGYVLREGETPYKHQSHPYSLYFYNIIDGEIHPIISDVISQQRFINKMSMQIDFMMGRAAKGVLFIPKQMLGGKYTEEELAHLWSTFDGTFAYDYKPGMPLPTQIHGNPHIQDASMMYQMQLSAMQEILGVNSAIQGQSASASVAASRYAQETANAQLNSKDLFERFVAYKEHKYTKIAKLVLQYYDQTRFDWIAEQEGVEINYDDIKNFEFDVEISQANVNGTYSMTESDQLYQMLLQGMIDLQTYLDISPASYAEKLSTILDKRRQEAEEQAMQQAAMQQAMQQEQAAIQQQAMQQEQAMQEAQEEQPQQQQQAPKNTQEEKLSIDERKMQEAKQNLEANPTDEQLKAALLNE